MKDEFEKWMIKNDGKQPNTASQYKSSIGLISRHYSQQINRYIDLYTISDILFIDGLVSEYGMGGKYQDIGQNGTGTNGHGTVRNAIATYSRFLKNRNIDNNYSIEPKNVVIEENESDNYEKENEPLEARYEILQKDNTESNNEFSAVKRIADELRLFMNRQDISDKIKNIHKVNTSSGKVQEIFLEKMNELGFTSERKGLFTKYRTSALRPDYYKKLEAGKGIIIEVERGKTIANNMDILDIWKCHICEEANYLFLIVPFIRQKKNGSRDIIYKKVIDRLNSFFQKNNYINIDAVIVFGY